MVLGASVHEQVIGGLGALPAPVAVHRPVAADDGRHAAGAGAVAPAFERGQIALARGREGVTTVGEAVQHQISDLKLGRELDQRVEVAEAGVDAAIGHHPQQVDPLARAQRIAQNRIACQRAVGDGVVDQRQRLRHHGSGAEGQVPDLRVTHLTLGQPDARAAGLERRVRIVRPQSIEAGLLCPVDRVAGARGGDSPPVQHDQAGAADLGELGAGGRHHRALTAACIRA